MDARDVIKIGMSAERILVVPPERTVGHFVKTMPLVYATPMMILEMEMTSGDAIARHLAPGWITVGTEVDVRHLAASPVGATIRTKERIFMDVPVIFRNTRGPRRAATGGGPGFSGPAR